MRYQVSKRLTVAAIAVAACLACGAANALPVFSNGSMAIAAFTTTTTGLATTTSYALSPATFTLASGAGDFTGLSATDVVASNLDLTNATTFDFSDPGIGTFAATPGSVLILPSPVNILSFFVPGTFTVGSDFANAGAVLSADETFSFTQTAGPGNAISISGTLQSPEVPPPIPEPLTLSLFGLGLAGLSIAARRKSRS